MDRTIATAVVLLLGAGLLGCAGSDPPPPPPPPGGGGDPVYDVDLLGVPRFVEQDTIELGKIERISKFRSGVGHDYADDFETCRSMKHYFVPLASEDWSQVVITCPVTGTVVRVEQEWAGAKLDVQDAAWPAFTFTIFHVTLATPLAAGDPVAAGQVLGTHVGSQTYSDVAVAVNTPSGRRLVSWFEVVTDALFSAYQARGMAARDDAIIPKAARDADPLACNPDGTFVDPGTLENWFVFP